MPYIVMQEAPSHDGTPCLSIWEDCNALDERYAKLASDGRPKYSIQFYDTTPNSRDPEHLKAVAVSIHNATQDNRSLGGDSENEDRLDIWGMAMPAETPDEERVGRCIAHMKREIVARNITGKSDFFIPGTLDRDSYRRVLIIINGTVDEWEWPENPQEYMNDDDGGDKNIGPFWVIFWGLPQAARERRQRRGEKIVDPGVSRIQPKMLADYLLQEVKEWARTFHQSFLRGGLLDREISRYVKRRAEHERGEVDWDALPEDGGLLGIENEINWTTRAGRGAEADSEVEEMRKQVKLFRIESGQEAGGGGSAKG